jgi:predicted permease
MRLYAILLHLYPASFRAEYSGEMRAMFARRWRDHARGGRTWLLLDALADALRNAPALHWEIVRQDVAFALRTIRRAPMVSATVVLVTALGIGATTAAFSVADHVLIKPLPFADPGRLVKVWQLPPGGGTLQASPGNFRDWRAENASFSSMAAFSLYSANLVGGGEPLQLDGSWVSGDLFGLLGVPPLAGRTIAPEDDRVTAPTTVVISERLWRTRFGAEPGVLGTSIILDDMPHVVVGIMPRTFEFPARTVDFWVPFQFDAEAYVYTNPYLDVIGRLKPGVSAQQADAEMQTLAREIGRRVESDRVTAMSALVSPLRDEISRQSRLLLWGLVGAAACLILIACTNLANLLLTRGLARRKELAVRAALGAGRHRLMRQMLTESAILAVAGGAAGVAIAAGAIPSIARLVPSSLPIAEVPALDLRLLALAAVMTLGTAIGFGLLPALHTARQADAAALRTGARSGAGRGSERLRSVLVVAQVSVSVLLLVACGLLLRSVLNVEGTEIGFRSEGVLVARTTLPVPKYEVVAVRQRFFGQVLDDVRAIPGVASAGYITGLPFAMRGRVWSVAVPERPELPPEERIVSLRQITPGFFATLGIPVVAGRDVSESDTQTSQQVAVVSASFVRRFWPGENPIGRRFSGSGPVGERVVVGVVGDIRWRGMEQESEPQLYLAYGQVRDGSLIGHIPRELVVKSSLSASVLVPRIRSAVARADAQQPVSNIQPLTDIVAGETAPRRVQVRVLGAFAIVALLLAAIGLHGLLAYNVSQSTREIGVRVALGAARSGILGMVMRHGMRLAIAGVVIGAVAAVAAGRILQSLLAGVSVTDAPAFGAATSLVVLATAAGSLLPALRAVRVDPVEVMRAE